MSILSQIISYAPNKIDTETKAQALAIGPRAMVGEITNEQTQFGRPIYKTPSGEKVSEKSITLFFNGNWMNVPSIHGGKSFNEDELRRMIKQGNIEPTSVHKSKDDAEAAAKDRSNSMVQEPRNMAQGGRIPFNNGGDTSPVRTEEYKYPRSNRFGTVYSKTPGKNQYAPMRSLEEIQIAIDNAPPIEIDGKLFEQNKKDLRGDSEFSGKQIVTRKEQDKYGDKLKYKSTGKKRIVPVTQAYYDRRARELAKSNPTILKKLSGKEGYQLSHLSLSELDTLKNLGYLPAEINLKQYFPFEKKIVEISQQVYETQNNKKLSIQEKRNKIAELQKKDRELRKKFPEFANTKARLNVKATGLDSSGLMIKEKLPDPNIAIAPTEAGTQLKGTAIGSDKGKKLLEIAKENLKKKIGSGTTLSANAFFDPSLMGKVISDIGKGINVGLGPTGMFLLTKYLEPEGGYDLSRTGDRLGFEAEAALAKPLVSGAVSVTDKIKNPMLRKIAERAALAGMSPTMAMKVASRLSPIGIASLAGEAVYKLGKLGYEDQKRFEALSPEEQAAERAEQEAFAFDVTGS